MDCCNYGQYGGGAGAGGGAGWEAYGAGAYPAPYAPYAHGYYAAHAHDPYARYYRYDYQPHHMHHAEHAMPMGGLSYNHNLIMFSTSVTDDIGIIPTTSDKLFVTTSLQDCEEEETDAPKTILIIYLSPSCPIAG